MIDSVHPRKHAPRRGTPAVAPIARAIRSALVASTMALSFAAPVIAHADNIVVSRTAPAAAFAQDSAFAAPFDPTVVPADAPPSAVIGASWLQVSLDDLGIQPKAEPEVEIDHEGELDIVDDVATGDALAVGLLADATAVATVRNNGNGSAGATSGDGNAEAYGAVAFGTAYGIGLIINAGDLSAEAIAGPGAEAVAAAGFVYAEVASLFNDLSMSASATAEGGNASARAAHVVGMYSAISNYGDMTASADATGGAAFARGAESYGYTGSSIYNAGDIQAAATAEGGLAEAVGTYSTGIISHSYTTNLGSIASAATGDQASANGVVNIAAYVGDAVTINEGNITASAVGGIAPYGEAEAMAFGIYNIASIYHSVIDNSGTVFASADATADILGTDGFLQAQAIGAAALNVNGYGQTVILNSGDIGASAVTSQGYASAWGVALQSNGLYGGAAWIENTGTLEAYSHADIGVAISIGAYLLNVAAAVDVVNHGDITAVADVERGIPNVSVNYAYATAVQAVSRYSDTSVTNYGDLTAVGHGYGAIVGARGIQAGGVNASVVNAAGATVTATGEVDLFGGGFATGIEAAGVYSVVVVNDGSVIVQGRAHAFSEGESGHYGVGKAIGIDAVANFQGDVSVTNSGDVIAIGTGEDSVTWAQGGAGATAIHAYAKYDAVVDNSGLLYASAEAQFGNVSAYGVMAKGKYSGSIVNHGDATIVALAASGSLAGDSYAGRAVSFGTHLFGTDYGTTENNGQIISHATSTPPAEGDSLNPGLAIAFGSAMGAYSSAITSTLVNRGDIEAVASADRGYATAYGGYVLSTDASTTVNEGSIMAAATSVGGDAWAVGNLDIAIHQRYVIDCDENGCDYANAYFVTDGGASSLENSGTIAALARAEGGVAVAYGTAVVGGLDAGIVNHGYLGAIAEGSDASAHGALVNSHIGSGILSSDGVIRAEATGDHANATGVMALGIEGVQVDNGGVIAAIANGADATAIAVRMESEATNTLVNTGDIGAFGGGLRVAVSSSDLAIADISNAGLITGAILTGTLDDSFDNAAGGTWHALGDTSFGDGDDSLVNQGAILLDDASVSFGGEVAGNVFDNFGVIAVRGAGNTIGMGSLGAFRNDGMISFANGVAGVRLAVTGGFAGEGGLVFDVDTVAGATDHLLIDGNVLASAVQTLDVNLLTRPDSASFEVALVDVTGDAVAGNFQLGDVHYAPGFLTLDFTLESRIDASNATDDQFLLGVSVAGLSGAGKLATTLSSGVQNLVDAQVGTWRQRAGAAPARGGDAPVTWVRGFSGSGDVDAVHHADFGSSPLGFHQSNDGLEIGVEMPVTESLSLGLLLGESDGRQSLHDGSGSAGFDGSTFGMYATWRTAGGFYADLSQRWTGIDARLRTVAGVVETDASASTGNLEVGLVAWTVGGVNIVPQLQYTHTRVGDITPLRVGASEFSDHGGSSSRGRLGIGFDRSFEAGSFLLTPYASVNVVREFDGEYSHAVNGGLAGVTDTAGTSGMLELGLGANRGPLEITGSASWTDGGAQDGVAGAQVSLRYRW